MQAEVIQLRDARGYRRASSTLPGSRRGHPSPRKGQTYAKVAPTALEVHAMLAACGPELIWRRQRALMAVLWRTGMRISEAVALTHDDLHRESFTVTVRSGKGGKHRTVPLDAWGWEELDMWLPLRAELPDGPIFCVVKGPTAGRRALDKRESCHYVRLAAKRAGVTRRMINHGFRHAFAITFVAEGGTLPELMLLLGHANLSVTGLYFASIQGATLAEHVGTTRARPMVPMPH